MTATRIIKGLEQLTATGEEAQSLARLGFLEWAFTLEGEATPVEAGIALESTAAQRPVSAAACAFVGFLRQATQPMLSERRRKGRNARFH